MLLSLRILPITLNQPFQKGLTQNPQRRAKTDQRCRRYIGNHHECSCRCHGESRADDQTPGDQAQRDLFSACEHFTESNRRAHARQRQQRFVVIIEMHGAQRFNSKPPPPDKANQRRATEQIQSADRGMDDPSTPGMAEEAFHRIVQNNIYVYSPRGNVNDIVSSTPCSRRTRLTPSSRSRSITACASAPAADPPAVSPIRRLPVSQPGLICSGASI